MTITATSRDGVAIAVHDLGGAGRPEALLIAHATGFHGRMYQPMADAGLTDRFHCIAPDLRGHGDSPAAPAQVSDWHRFGDDVAAVAAAIDVEPGRLFGFGHSMGGAALVLAELANPGTFAGLWLFEPILPPPAAFPPEGDNPMATSAERRREVFDSFEAAIANYAAKPPLSVFTPAAMRAYVEHGFEPLPDGTVRLKCRGAVEAATFRAAPLHQAFTRLAELACPVVIGVGRPSMGPTMFAAAAAEVIPSGRLEPFDDLGHFGPQEAPQEIATAVVRDL